VTYRASCSNGYGERIDKTFKTVEEAQAWYSETKKHIVKEQAQRAFLENAIKTDVYLALVRREF
jgi:viroplasmin and RNaseH domain-containing protein